MRNREPRLMGTAIEVHCQNCGAKRQYSLGVGRLFYVDEFAFNHLTKHHRSAAKHTLKHWPGSTLGVALQLAHCPGCHRLASVGHARVRLGESLVYEADHYCRKCDERMELIEEEGVATIPCYKCGGRLTGWDEAAILWD